MHNYVLRFKVILRLVQCIDSRQTLAAVEGVPICVRLIVLVVGSNLVNHLVGDLVRARYLLVLPLLQWQNST